MKKSQKLTKFSFGATSSIITSLALITSFDINTQAKFGVIATLLVIAIADNISDSLGIHIYQEGENCKIREVWLSTLTNFLTRFMVTSVFIFLVLIFPPVYAILFSIFYGFIILTIISYLIARKRGLSAFHAIAEHIIIATLVIIVSKYLRGYLISLF